MASLLARGYLEVPASIYGVSHVEYNPAGGFVKYPKKLGSFTKGVEWNTWPISPLSPSSLFLLSISLLISNILKFPILHEILDFS